MSKPEIPQEARSKFVDTAWSKQAERIKDSVKERVSFLQDHRDLVTEEMQQEILRREILKAQSDFINRRLEGHVNDNYSRKPGVTVYLRFEGYIGANKVCKDAGYPIPDDQKSFEITPYMSVIELPKGVYGMGMGGAQFYQEADDNFEEDRASRRKPFAMPYDDVVRVEGADGELWQNVDYEWDGSSKNPQ